MDKKNKHSYQYPKNDKVFIISNDLKITLMNIQDETTLFFEDNQPRLVMNFDQWVELYMSF